MIKEDLKNQKYSQLAGDLVRAVQGSKMDTSGFENIALRDAANNYLHRKSEVLVKAINSYMSSQGM